MDCRLPGSSVHGILQARILEWVAVSSSRRSSRPRDQTCVSCTDRWLLYYWTTRDFPHVWSIVINSITHPYVPLPGLTNIMWLFPLRSSLMLCAHLFCILPWGSHAPHPPFNMISVAAARPQVPCVGHSQGRPEALPQDAEWWLTSCPRASPLPCPPLPKGRTSLPKGWRIRTKAALIPRLFFLRV